MASEVRYPDLTVKLVGEDGNAFVILARVRRALLDAGAPSREVADFLTETTAGDYDHLLRVCMRWVNVE